jgi:hypothetical protein
MSAKTAIDEHETRVSIITAIGVRVAALAIDQSTREVRCRDDRQAERLLYAEAFQAWADGRIEGSAEDVFETVQEVLEA